MSGLPFSLKSTMVGLVYSYTRFSDPKQSKGHSYERQMALAESWAAAKGLKLDATLSMHDEGLSAFHGHHTKSGALGIFLAAVEAGRVPRGSYLLVEQFDRLSRRTAMEAFRQFSDLIAAGITIVTTKDGREFSAASLEAQPFSMFESIMPMILANQESANKSKRVVASIRGQCEGWVAGTNRKLIRNGGDPVWLKRVGDEWQLVPERVAGVRAAISLFMQGMGPKPIIKKLRADGITITGGQLFFMQIYRVIKQRALIGEKTLTVDNETFNLEGYYPPILSQSEFAELEAVIAGKVRRVGQCHVVPFLTGIRVATCGYCGQAMVNHSRRSEASGLLFVRIGCSSPNSRRSCDYPTGVSIVPFEKALMNFCSDMINLNSLYGVDQASIPQARLNKANAELAKVTGKLDKLTEAMLLTEGGGTIATFAKKARELETEQGHLTAAVEAAERDVAHSTRTAKAGSEKSWRQLADAVLAYEDDARLKARRLVSETFDNIVFYPQGLRPSEGTSQGLMDMVLFPKGGQPRTLRVDKDGNWISGEAVGDQTGGIGSLKTRK